MRCPVCRHRMCGISPSSRVEWKCVNTGEGCPASKGLIEFYGRTQKEVDEGLTSEEQRWRDEWKRMREEANDE